MWWVDLKMEEFKPEHAGKMNFYLSVVDDLLKAEADAPSIGLILCKTKNNLQVEYALRGLKAPLGVSEFHILEALPTELESSLPTVETTRSRIERRRANRQDSKWVQRTRHNETGMDYEPLVNSFRLFWDFDQGLLVKPFPESGINFSFASFCACIHCL